MAGFFVGCLFPFISFQAGAQAVNEFTVAQAVDYAKKNTVQVRNAILDLEIQKQTNKEITARALPSITGNGNFTDFLQIPTNLLPGEFFGQPGTFIPVKFGVKYNATGGVALNQLLFDGQVFVGLQARKASLDFYGKQIELTEEVINANVQKVYYQLVVGRQQLTSIQANIDRFKKLLADTKEIFNQGFAERLDVDKVSVQLNNLETEKVKLINQLAAGNAGLKFLMNMPQKDSLVLVDSISPEMIKDNIMDQSYAYSDRKEFQLQQVARSLRAYDVKRYKLSSLPTLSLFSNYSKNAQRNDFNFFAKQPWFTNSSVGLSLTVPIFEGFAKKARVDRAKLELKKVDNSLEQLENQIDNDVQQARINMASALATIDNQQRNVKLAEQVYNTTKLKYEQGLGSNQEIYTAQTELKVAQNNYYAAMYDAVVAKIDFLRATGKLDQQ